jgi:hypothetical protein
MQCNIDERGARYRRLWGVTNLLAAAVLAALAAWSAIWWIWIIVAVCAAFGTLGLYEARKKWCIMRALGVKTPV